MNKIMFNIRSSGSDSKLESIYQPVKPENVLLVVNTNDSDAIAMSNYYKVARNIPDDNILNFSLTWIPSDGYDINETDQENLLTALCNKLDSIPTITTICPVGHFPIRPSPEFVAETGYSADQTSIVHILAKPFLAKYYRKIGLYKQETNVAATVHGLMPKDLVHSASKDAPYTNGVEREHPFDLGIDRWQQGTEYAVGDKVWIEAGVPYWRILEATVGGQSGSVEPTTYIGSFSDNEVTWEAIIANKPRTYPPSFKLPANHYSMQRAIGADTNGDWDARLAYMVTFLDAPYVGANDPTFASRQELFEYMIDSAIAVENKFSEPWGNVVLSGSTGFGSVSAGAYISLRNREFKGEIYHEAMSGLEQSLFPDYQLPTVNNFPAGANTLSPEDGSTFIAIDNVAFHALGYLAYFSGRRSIKPDEIIYAQGAINVSGQSCGAIPATWGSLDTVYDPIDILSSANGSGAELNAFQANRHIGIPVPNGPTAIGFALRYEPPGAELTATVAFPIDNQIVLRVDGGVVATINLTNGPWIDHRATILAALPAGWSASESCINYESRAVRALRNGAAVAIGQPVEPGTHNTATTTLLEVFYSGGTLANAMMAFLTDDMRNGLSSGGDAYPIFYGDPLYSPFLGE